jgi:hypothetical protein
MKKIILNRYNFILVLLVGLMACEDDIKYKDDFGRTFNAAPFICIDHINADPATGAILTEEEELGLTYNACEKVIFFNTYDIEANDLDLVFTTNMRPLSIEVQDPTSRETIVELTDIVQEDGMFKATYNSSFANLGIADLGDKVSLEFVAIYDLGEPTGETIVLREPFTVEYKLYVDPNAVTPYVFLKKSTGETEDLATIGDGDITNNVSNIFVGRDLAFDGTDDQIQITDGPQLAFRNTDDYSVGVWVKTTGDFNDPAIIADKNWSGGANPGFVLAYKGASGGVWKLNIGDGSNRIDIDGGSINDDQWHFIMATMDRDGDAVIYQDGLEVGRTNMAAIGDATSGNPIRLAQDGEGDYPDWFVGNLGEVFIFDYAVTPEEVANISTQRSGVQVRLQDGTVKNIPVTTTGGFDPIDEDGKFSFKLDGTDDYATIDASGELDFAHLGDFTVAYWVKTTATNSDPVIVGNRQWEGGSHIGTLTAFTGGTWRAVSATPTRVNINGISTINDGEWHLLTITRDRDGLKTVYMDGTAIETADISGVTGSFDSGFPWRIGQDADANYGDWFEGSVANCMFFDYVLTGEQVLNLLLE